MKRAINSLQMSDIRFLQVSFLFSFLVHFVLEASRYLYIWVLKIVGIQNLVGLLKVLKLHFFLKFWADKFRGLQICWYPKHVGTKKCGYNEISNLLGTQNWWQL